MGEQTELIKKPAPTLYAIIAIKLLKGLLFMSLALFAYVKSDNDLPQEYRNLIKHLKLNPEQKFWADLAKRVEEVTEKNVLWLAFFTMIYSMFSLVEGTGMLFRVSWAGWMAICESIFFIPIEIYELVHKPADPTRKGHPVIVITILVINIWIVWYLVKNKHRLFRHHQRH